MSKCKTHTYKKTKKREADFITASPPYKSLLTILFIYHYYIKVLWKIIGKFSNITNIN